jgi:hypothetical protein
MPKVKVHGFGLTSLPMMLRYPWWSVDSTSWVMTGRMGGIFVPRWVEGKGWVYDGRSWKLSVSNMSPDKNELNSKHFNTLTPKLKKIYTKYIEDSGYSMGHSEFKNVPIDHVLKENEKWAEPKPKTSKNKPIVVKSKSAPLSFFESSTVKANNDPTQRLLEIIVEPGISNKYQLRDEMNIIYFLELEKHIPKYPWAFIREVKEKHKA